MQVKFSSEYNWRDLKGEKEYISLRLGRLVNPPREPWRLFLLRVLKEVIRAVQKQKLIHSFCMTHRNIEFLDYTETRFFKPETAKPPVRLL